MIETIKSVKAKADTLNITVNAIQRGDRILVHFAKNGVHWINELRADETQQAWHDCLISGLNFVDKEAKKRGNQR